MEMKFHFSKMTFWTRSRTLRCCCQTSKYIHSSKALCYFVGLLEWKSWLWKWWKCSSRGKKKSFVWEFSANFDQIFFTPKFYSSRVFRIHPSQKRVFCDIRNEMYVIWNFFSDSHLKHSNKMRKKRRNSAKQRKGRWSSHSSRSRHHRWTVRRVVRVFVHPREKKLGIHFGSLRKFADVENWNTFPPDFHRETIIESSLRCFQAKNTAKRRREKKFNSQPITIAQHHIVVDPQNRTQSEMCMQNSEFRHQQQHWSIKISNFIVTIVHSLSPLCKSSLSFLAVESETTTVVESVRHKKTKKKEWNNEENCGKLCSNQAQQDVKETINSILNAIVR